MDPALSSTAATKDLVPDKFYRTLLTCQAKAESHLHFVNICIQNRVISIGLRLTTTPQVFTSLSPDQAVLLEEEVHQARNVTSPTNY